MARNKFYFTYLLTYLICNFRKQNASEKTEHVYWPLTHKDRQTKNKT